MSGSRYNFETIRQAITVENFYETGLFEAELYHGTTSDQVKSIMRGPKNTGRGFGGEGLYVTTEEQCAHEFADHAFDKIAGNKSKCGRVIMKGEVGLSGDCKVARISIAKRGQAANVEKGIFPPGWYEDIPLNNFIKQNYDVLKISGLKSGGYNSDLDEFYVFHERSGKQAIKWRQQKKVSQLKPGSYTGGRYTGFNKFQPVNAPMVDPKKITVGTKIPGKGKVLLKKLLHKSAIPAIHAAYHVYAHSSDNDTIVTATKDFAVMWSEVLTAESAIGAFVGEAAAPLMIAGEMADNLENYTDPEKFKALVENNEKKVKDAGQAIEKLYADCNNSPSEFAVKMAGEEFPGSAESLSYLWANINYYTATYAAQPFSEFLQPILRNFSHTMLKESAKVLWSRLSEAPSEEDIQNARKIVERKYKEKKPGWFQTEASFKLEEHDELRQESHQQMWQRIEAEEKTAHEAAAREKRSRFNINTGDYDLNPDQARVQGNPGVIREIPVSTGSSVSQAGLSPVPSIDSADAELGHDDNPPGDNPGSGSAPDNPAPESNPDLRNLTPHLRDLLQEEKKSESENKDDVKDANEEQVDRVQITLRALQDMDKLTCGFNQIRAGEKQYKREARKAAQEGKRIIANAEEAMDSNREGRLQQVLNRDLVVGDDPSMMQLYAERLMKKMDDCHSGINAANVREARVRKVMSAAIKGMKETVKKLKNSSFIDFESYAELNVITTAAMIHPVAGQIAELAVSLGENLGILGGHRRSKKRQLARKLKSVQRGAQNLDQGVSLLNMNAQNRREDFYSLQSYLQHALQNYALSTEEQLRVTGMCKQSLQGNLHRLEESEENNQKRLQQLRVNTEKYAHDHHKRFHYTTKKTKAQEKRVFSRDEQGLPVPKKIAEDKHIQHIQQEKLRAKRYELMATDFKKSKKPYEDELKWIECKEKSIRENQPRQDAHRKWMIGGNEISEHNLKINSLDVKIKDKETEIKKLKKEKKTSATLEKELQALKEAKSKLTDRKEKIDEEKKEETLFKADFYKRTQEAEEKLQKQFYNINVSINIAGNTLSAIHELVFSFSNRKDLSNEDRKKYENGLAWINKVQAGIGGVSSMINIWMNYQRYAHKSKVFGANWSKLTSAFVDIGNEVYQGNVDGWGKFSTLLSDMTYDSAGKLSFADFLSYVVNPGFGILNSSILLVSAIVKSSTHQLQSKELNAIENLSETFKEQFKNLSLKVEYLTGISNGNFRQINVQLEELQVGQKRIEKIAITTEKQTRKLLEATEADKDDKAKLNKQEVDTCIETLRGKLTDTGIFGEISLRNTDNANAGNLMPKLNMSIQHMLNALNNAKKDKCKSSSEAGKPSRSYVSPHDFILEFTRDLHGISEFVTNARQTLSQLPNLRVLIEETIIFRDLFDLLMNNSTPALAENNINPELILKLMNMLNDYSEHYLVLLSKLNSMALNPDAKDSLIYQLGRDYSHAQLKLFESVDQGCEQATRSQLSELKASKDKYDVERRKNSLGKLENTKLKFAESMVGSGKFNLQVVLHQPFVATADKSKAAAWVLPGLAGGVLTAAAGCMVAGVGFAVAGPPGALYAESVFANTFFWGVSAIGGVASANTAANIYNKLANSSLLEACERGSPDLSSHMYDTSHFEIIHPMDEKIRYKLFNAKVTLNELSRIPNQYAWAKIDYPRVQDYQESYNNELMHMYSQYVAALQACLNDSAESRVYTNIEIGNMKLEDARLLPSRNPELLDLFFPNKLIENLIKDLTSPKNNINLYNHAKIGIEYDFVLLNGNYEFKIFFINEKNNELISGQTVARFSKQTVNGFVKPTFQNGKYIFTPSHQHLEFILLAMYASKLDYMGMPTNNSMILDQFREYTFVEERQFCGLYSILERLATMRLTVVNEVPKPDNSTYMNDLILYVNEDKCELYQGAMKAPLTKKFHEFISKDKPDDLTLFEYIKSNLASVLKYIDVNDIVHPVMPCFNFDYQKYNMHGKNTFDKFTESGDIKPIKKYISDENHNVDYVMLSHYEPEYSTACKAVEDEHAAVKKDLYSSEFDGEHYQSMCKAYNDLKCLLHIIFGKSAAELALKKLNILSPSMFKADVLDNPSMNFIEYSQLMPDLQHFDNNDLYHEFLDRMESSGEFLPELPRDYYDKKVDTFMDEHPGLNITSLKQFSLFAAEVKLWLQESQLKNRL